MDVEARFHGLIWLFRQLKRIIWAIVWICLLASNAKASLSQLEPGVFASGNWDWQGESVILEGTWRFFPGELLKPADARTRFAQGAPLRIPGAWNDVKRPDGTAMGAHGYGTYIARLDQVPSSLLLTVRLTYATSNYRLFWLRGEDAEAEVVIEAGRVGTSEAESLPQFLEKLHEVKPLEESGSAWIVVHVSNYHWVQGGMFYAPEIGATHRMEHAFAGRFMSSLILCGLFIMLIFFNLSIYLRQRDEKFALWLMLASVIALLTTATYFSQIFYYFLPIDVRVHQGFRYGQNAFSVLVLTVFNQLVRLQYRRHTKDWIAYVMWTVTILSHIVYALMPFTVPLPILRLNQMLVLTFPFLVTWQVWGAFRAREANSAISLFGFAFFFATVLNDLLVIFRFVTLPMLSNWGLMVMIFLQTQILAIKFAQALHRARSMSQELAELNQSLEQRVALQTREIRSLLTHVKIGIFGLIGGEKKISKDYSRQLEIIFEDEHLEGRHGLQLLLEGSDLLQDQMEQIDHALNTCMGEAEVNFQMNAHVLPQTLQRLDKNGQVHQFELTWDAVLNEQGLIAMILVTVNDVTELRKLESVAQRKAVELTMVGEILAIQEDDFRRLVRDSRELLQHSRGLLQPGEDPGDALRLILIDIHTLKGTARTLHLSRLTEALHNLEKRFKGQSLADGNALILLGELDHIRLVVQDYDDIARQKLKIDANETQVVKVKKEILQSSFVALKKLLPRLPLAELSAWEPLFSWLQQTHEIALDQLLRAQLQMSARIAADLDKPAPRLVLDVPAISCNEAMELALRKIFVHLLRNMLDHGIESPEERRAKGKTPEGVINVIAEVHDGELVLQVGDDGRGLDLDSLQKKAVGTGANLDEHAAAELIFADGISTAQKVTDISGQGIGMAAVKSFVESNGGSVQVVLTGINGSRRSFHLRIKLPLAGFTSNPFAQHSAA